MLKGPAEGGPRDGVTLTAEASWDGRIKLPESPSNARTNYAYYPGYYEWMYGKWVWHEIRRRY